MAGANLAHRREEEGRDTAKRPARGGSGGMSDSLGENAAAGAGAAEARTDSVLSILGVPFQTCATAARGRR